MQITVNSKLFMTFLKTQIFSIILLCGDTQYKDQDIITIVFSVIISWGRQSRSYLALVV